MRVNCVILLLLAQYAVEKARADGPVVVQNDSFAPGVGAYAFTGFREHDIGAAIFALPEGVDAFRIDGVQILWGSDQSPCLDTTYVNVHLFKGVLPDPGDPFGTIDGVPMQVGGFNQVSPLQCTQPREWWVYRADGSFAVGVEYLFAWTQEGYDMFNNTYPTVASSAITNDSGHLMLDSAGCEPGKNMVFDTATQAWEDPAAHDLPGNFVIRLVGMGYASRAPFGDFDRDNDVDQEDFGAFQACWTGPNGTATPECAAAFDCARDGRIDIDDLEQFVNCLSGPMIAASTTCGQCLPMAIMSPLATLHEPMSKGDGRENAIWGLLVFFLIFLVAFFIVYEFGTNGRMNIHVGANRFITAGVCPDGAQLANLSTAIERFGPTGDLAMMQSPVIGLPPIGSPDPRVAAIYPILKAALKDCNGGANRVFVVPRGVSRNNGVYATTLMHRPDVGSVPDGMELIFINEDFVADPGGDLIAEALFTQGDHILNRRSTLTHQDLEDRLLEFMAAHPIGATGPGFHHGHDEGMQNP